MGHKKTVAAIVVTILVLFGASYFSFYLGKKSVDPVNTNQSGDYPLLAKRIFVENPAEPFINFSTLRSQLNQYYTDSNLKGSLYFEYLPTGTSIKIDGDVDYVAASLIKLPAAMDLYKASELGKVDINKTITLQQDWLDAAYGELYKKGAGYQLTLKEAAKIMLEDSDNTALRAIGTSINGLLQPDEQSYNSLDVDLLQNADLTVSVSSRSYSSFLKCLYFACYLNKDNSQELLNYLSHTKYSNRLVAGIKDSNITVAHKTGNYAQDTQSDCGIVYLPNMSYLLCVMIKGQDNPSTDQQIAELSEIVYTYITSVKAKTLTQ